MDGADINPMRESARAFGAVGQIGRSRPRLRDQDPWSAWPGLLEGAYEACLANDISKAGLTCQRQIAMPVFHEDQKIDLGFVSTFLSRDVSS
jgi:hypothetical protein